MHRFIFFIFLLIAGSASAIELPRSLSCSKDGTTIFYINGIATNFGQYQDSLKDIGKNLRPILNRIDEKIDVSVTGQYNTSEGALLDYYQLIEQKLAGAKVKKELIPDLIAKYFFDIKSFVNDVGAAKKNEIEEERLLRQYQGVISENDSYKMARSIYEELFVKKRKVIIVSHSQGNIYANNAYKKLISMSDPSSNIIEKNLGNLQVGSVAKGALIKKSKIFTMQHDAAVNYLRLKGFPVSGADYSLSYNGSCDKDFGLCHYFSESYMSSDVLVNGPKQNNGNVYRSALDTFRDLAEEVAWMLANNDERCCEGKDGRFHLNHVGDNILERGGFLENTVMVNSKNVQIAQDSMVCGNVTIDKKMVNAKDRTNLLIINSKIDSKDPIKLKGNISLLNSNLSNLGEVNKTMSLDGGSLGLLLNNGTDVNGAPTISGDIIMNDTAISGDGSYSGEKFVHGDDDFSPLIDGAGLLDNNTITGFYVIERFMQNSKVSGKVFFDPTAYFPNSLATVYLKSTEDGLVNSEVSGVGIHYGKIGPFADIRSNEIDYNNAIFIPLGSEVVGTETARAEVSGKTVIWESKITSSKLDLDLSLVGGYPWIMYSQISNSFAFDGVGLETYYAIIDRVNVYPGDHGTPYIYQSSVSDSVVECDASIWNETITGGTYSCGYHSPIPEEKSKASEAMKRYVGQMLPEASQKYFSRHEQLISEAKDQTSKWKFNFNH